MEEKVKAAIFWQLAESMIANGLAKEGTMMGFTCLRTDEGGFFASLERNTNNLIVKLPAERVQELISDERANPFAPNGRVFREWATISDLDENQWNGYIHEALEFAQT